MVDWDRVRELRAKGWDWDQIADDSKVGFHPDASVREPGRALRALYHRQRSARERQGEVPVAPKRKEAGADRRWTPLRLLWLFVPIVAIWALLAYAAPSPVGLIVPAFPWLALALAVLAFGLIFLLFKAEKRWNKVFRTTLIGGVLAGLLFAGMVGLVGALVFGCPLLPPSSALSSHAAGWTSGGISAWQENGKPVVYFYGATWCPYCSASSWAVWKALTEFGPAGSVSGAYTDYSSASDVYPQTPEMVLADIQLSNSAVAFQVSEDTSGSDGTFPSTSGCYQQAYVSAYSGGSIPFVVVNGQYVHGGSTLVGPSQLSAWAGSGAGTVQTSVAQESGTPWSSIQTQAWWTMAYMAKATGIPVSTLASTYHWSTATQNAVAADVNQIG